VLLLPFELPPEPPDVELDPVVSPTGLEFAHAAASAWSAASAGRRKSLLRSIRRLRIWYGHVIPGCLVLSLAAVLDFPDATMHRSVVKLSSKGRYGVRALFDIAFHSGGGPTQIREIAERELIPARFLEQIFQDLKKAGLIGSKRGPRGGYHLARPASEIRIGDVIRALEGPSAVRLTDEDGAKTKAPADATASVFRDLAASIERCFDAVTIADVCDRGAELGMKRRSRDRTSYVI
jgi:Rrf2 family protein